MAIRLPGQVASVSSVVGGAGSNTALHHDAASLTSSSANMPDLTAFSALARRALTDALDRVRAPHFLFDISLYCCHSPLTLPFGPAQIAGAKTLVLDANLAGPLGLVAEMSLLRVSLSPSSRSM
jgi:hypothetical protein